MVSASLVIHGRGAELAESFILNLAHSFNRQTKPSIVDQEYPHNLLTAIVEYTKMEAPLNMNPDRIRGLQYAMPTLEPREYEVLMYR